MPATAPPNGIFSEVSGGFGSDQFLNVAFACIFGTCQGVKPTCPLYGAKFAFPDQGCWQFSSNTGGDPLMISDREDVINLHVGVPRANGLRDDVQLLWSGSALNGYGYNSPSDLGPGINQFIYSLYNTKYAPPVCGNEPFATWGSIVVLSGYGCASPVGSAQQIYSFLQPQQFFLGRYGYSGPLRCPMVAIACGPTYSRLRRRDNLQFTIWNADCVELQPFQAAPSLLRAGSTIASPRWAASAQR